MVKPVVFLSHSERDRDLASALSAAMATQLRISRQEIFQSSRWSIRSSQQVLKAITNAIRQADAVVVLLTPNSLWSPWVHFEAGGGHFSSGKKFYVISARGIGATATPSNLHPYSVKELGSRNSVRQFLKDLVADLRRPARTRVPRVPTQQVDRVVKLAAKGSRGWNLVEPAMIARNVSESPFQLRKLVTQASKSIFLIGQNLWYPAKGRDAAKIKAELFRFLQRRGTTVRILLQEPDTDGARAWNCVQSDFAKDLTDSVATFRIWLADAKIAGLKRRFTIKTAKLVPLSFDVFDAELPSGCMVIRPVLQRAPQPYDRPAVALYGGIGNPVFRYYRDLLDTAFALGVDLK